MCVIGILCGCLCASLEFCVCSHAHWRVLAYYSYKNGSKLFLYCEVLICRRRHKNDCLCAICVLKRRRREREENARLAKGHIGATDNSYTEETQQEVQ